MKFSPFHYTYGTDLVLFIETVLSTDTVDQFAEECRGHFLDARFIMKYNLMRQAEKNEERIDQSRDDHES